METRNNVTTQDNLVPNLDCMSDKDLELLIWGRGVCARPTWFARCFFPERPRGYVRAACDLANYAQNLQVARQCRARGDILTAQQYEDICERIYQQLPKWARW